MYVTVVTPDLLSVLDELDNSKEILSLLLSSSGTGHLQVKSKSLTSKGLSPISKSPRPRACS